MLYALAIRLTKRAEDADDLVQDTLLRAFCSFERFRAGSNCRAWLATIMTNCFISKCRKKRRHDLYIAERVHMLAESNQKCPWYGDSQISLRSGAWSDEVQSALESLPRGQRAVVVLADVHDVSYRQIATVLSIPVGTVMSRLFRARRVLQQCLSEYARADYGFAA